MRYIKDNNEIKYLLLQNKNKEIISNEENTFGNNTGINNNRDNNNNININNNNDLTNNNEDGNIFNNDANSQTGVTRIQNIQYNNMVMDSLLLRTNEENPYFTNNNQKINGMNNKSNLNVENDPRVLTFTTKQRNTIANNNTANFINKMKSLGENKDFFGKNTKNGSERIISKTPERILDAPNLIDDYYLNLLDWSRNNVVAVGLGIKSFLFVRYFIIKFKINLSYKKS